MPGSRIFYLILVGEEAESSSAIVGMRFFCLIPGTGSWICLCMGILLQGGFLIRHQLRKKDTVWKDTLRRVTGAGVGIGEKEKKFLQVDWTVFSNSYDTAYAAAFVDMDIKSITIS